MNDSLNLLIGLAMGLNLLALGTSRLPVLIRYTYFTDDQPTTRQAVYDLVWETHGRPLRGRVVELIDLRLRETGGNQARIDALWAKDHPAT